MSSPSPEPRWLISGSGGFLGANLRLFLRDRALVIAGVRQGSHPISETINHVELNLEQPQTFEATLQASRPDVVVHAGGLTSHEACEADPALAWRVNVEASAALAQAAAGIGARFVQISTDAVFDGLAGHYTEMDSPRPFSVYGRTKAEAEERVLDVPRTLVIRTNFFGWSPSGQRSILEFFVRNLRARCPVKGFTDFTVTSSYVQDLCGALWELAQHEASGILHVTSRDPLSKYDFGQCVAQEFDLDAALISPGGADVQPPRNRDLSLDVTRAESVLGHPLASQAEGIRRARHDEDALRRALDSLT